jgi:hypothetical protein
MSASIRLVADFQRPGIRIRDISPVVEGDPDLFASLIEIVSSRATRGLEVPQE